MLVLVTGGAGFIGGHVAEALLAAGHDVRLLDNLHPAAHGGMPDDLPAGAEFVRGDVREGADLDAALEGVDAVCHQAAMVGLGTDIGDIADYVAHNDLGTAVLLRTLAARSYRGRLVQASSMVVYGEGRYACPEHGQVRPGPREVADLEAGRFEPPCPRCGRPLEPQAVPEDAPLDPRNVYAATKLQQEHLAAAFSRETGVPVTSLRYHNVYGPRMPRDTPYAGWRPSSPAPWRPAGRPASSRTAASCATSCTCATSPAPTSSPSPPPTPSRPFNVCSGTPRSVGDMARALWEATDGGAPEPEVTGTSASATCATSSPRPSAPVTSSASPRGGLPRGHGGVRPGQAPRARGRVAS
jgi:dTDP-L-rhamnose 4-epimerase